MKRQVQLVGLAGLIVGAIVFGLASATANEYTATATLRLNPSTSAEAIVGSGAPHSAATSEREAATSEQLAELLAVDVRTARRTDGLSPDDVANMVSVTGGDAFDLISIKATASSPGVARELANTFAHQFVAWRQAGNRAALIEARERLESSVQSLSAQQSQGETGQMMRRTRARLAALVSQQTGGATVVAAGLPTTPSSPKPFRDALIAALVTLVAGVGIVLVVRHRRNRLDRQGDPWEAADLPVIATVSRGESGNAAVDWAAAGKEAVRALGGTVGSVLTTSGYPNEGASEFAYGLACVAAPVRSVIIEVRRRQPTFAARHELASRPGLAELLNAEAELEEAVQDCKGPPGQNSVTLHAIVAGSELVDPTGSLDSEAMERLHTELRERYDLVVFDAPPIDVAIDAFPLVRRVDAVIAVGPSTQVTRFAAQALGDELRLLGARTLGFVVNLAPVTSDQARPRNRRRHLRRQSEASEGLAP